MTSLALDSAAIASTVERAIAGDELAFARLVGAYHLDLVRVAYVVCGDEGLAEDAAQAAWWIAWRKLPSLRDHDRPKPWLVAVAANEARKLAKRERRHPVVELKIESDPSPGADPAGAIDHVDLANALGHLKPEDRALVALRYDQWKIVFAEQRAHGLNVWQDPFVTLRFPKLFNLRSDPFEEADHIAMDYGHWRIDRTFLLVPAQQYVGQYIATFKEFPPTQKVGSFSLDQVLEKLNSAQTSGK